MSGFSTLINGQIELFDNAISQFNQKTIIPLFDVMELSISNIKGMKKSLLKSRQTYEQNAAKFSTLSKYREEPLIREDAHNLLECKQEYIDILIQYYNLMNTFIIETEISLGEMSLSGLQASWQLGSKYQQLVGAMHAVAEDGIAKLNATTNLSSWKEEEQQQKQQQKQQQQQEQEEEEHSSWKKGYLFYRKTPSSWKRVFWELEKDTGILTQQISLPTPEQIEITFKISVSLLKFRELPLYNNVDRRNCFEISIPSLPSLKPFLYQLENSNEMMLWFSEIEECKKYSPKKISFLHSSLTDTLPLNYPEYRKLQMSLWIKDNLLIDEVLLLSILDQCFWVGESSHYEDCERPLTPQIGAIIISDKMVYLCSNSSSEYASSPRLSMKFDWNSIKQISLTDEGQLVLTYHNDSLGGMIDKIISIRNGKMSNILNVFIFLKAYQNLLMLNETSRMDVTLLKGTVDSLMRGDDIPHNFKIQGNGKDIEDGNGNVLEEVSCGCEKHLEQPEIDTLIPGNVDLIFQLLTGPVYKNVFRKRLYKMKSQSDWSTMKIDDKDCADINKKTENVKMWRKSHFSVPVNHPLVRVKETDCYETQRLIKYETGKRYVLWVENRTPGVMYGDCFFAEVMYCITMAPSRTIDGQRKEFTRLKTCTGLVWRRNPFVKGIIKSATILTLREYMSDTLQALYYSLKAHEKNIPSSSPSSKSSLISTNKSNVSLEIKEEKGLNESNRISNAIFIILIIIASVLIPFVVLLSSRRTRITNENPINVLQGLEMRKEKLFIIKENLRMKLESINDLELMIDEALQRSKEVIRHYEMIY